MASLYNKSLHEREGKIFKTVHTLEQESSEIEPGAMNLIPPHPLLSGGILVANSTRIAIVPIGRGLG